MHEAAQGPDFWALQLAGSMPHQLAMMLSWLPQLVSHPLLR
jgi:hypothetical protein